MKILFLIILINLLFLICPAFALTYSPSEVQIGLYMNETKNITFNIANADNVTYNISFHNAHLENFSRVYFPLRIENATITAQVKPFESEGEFNDTIKVLHTENLTITTLVEIPIRFFIGKKIIANFVYKKCFIDNATEYCTDINITDLQNITILNQTNITQENNYLVPIDVLNNMRNDFVKTVENITNSVSNATDRLAEKQTESEVIYRNAQVIKGYLKNSLNTWIEVMPTNILKNVTGLNDKDFSMALQYLEQNKEITSRITEEDLPYVTVIVSGGKPATPTKTVKHTEIALVSRVDIESIWFIAEIFVTLCVVGISSFVIILRINSYNKSKVGFKKVS